MPLRPYYALIVCLYLSFTSTTNAWSEYFAAMKGSPARILLTNALVYCPIEGSAIDLGAGAGQDTLSLLQQGWHVLAVDEEEESGDLITEQAESRHLDSKLAILISAFENLPFAFLRPMDLIYGGFSLPFCHPAAFPVFWGQIKQNLKKEGILAVNLFGIHHSWHLSESMTFHTRQQVEAMFEGFDILQLEEIDEVEDDAVRWHYFNIIARKK